MRFRFSDMVAVVAYLLQFFGEALEEKEIDATGAAGAQLRLRDDDREVRCG